MAAHQPDPERSLLPSQSIPSTHPWSHRPWENTALSNNLQARRTKLRREQRQSGVEQLACLLCSESASLSLLFVLHVRPRQCRRCFYPQQRGVWMCQVIVGLIKGKFKDQWKDVTGLTRPDDNQLWTLTPERHSDSLFTLFTLFCFTSVTLTSNITDKTLIERVRVITMQTESRLYK